MRKALPLALLLGLAVAVSGAASSSPPTDRTVKLNLIAKLRRGPEILILGDSRGRQAEPSFLQRLTGHTGFNAAVQGGSAPEAWVFARYTADRFPGQKRRYKSEAEHQQQPLHAHSSAVHPRFEKKCWNKQTTCWRGNI